MTHSQGYYPRGRWGDGVRGRWGEGEMGNSPFEGIAVKLRSLKLEYIKGLG
jgi:hypothetical protein